MGSLGAGAAGALGGVTVTAAAPVVVGGAAVLCAGWLVSKCFKLIRQDVMTHQEQRRRLLTTATRLELERGGLALDVSAIELRGRDDFSHDELAAVRDLVVELAQGEGSERRSRILARLRRLGFYVSDWSRRGEGFDLDQLDALIATGRIHVADG
jgi:hypothetical protein